VLCLDDPDSASRWVCGDEVDLSRELEAEPCCFSWRQVQAEGQSSGGGCGGKFGFQVLLGQFVPGIDRLPNGSMQVAIWPRERCLSNGLEHQAT
jgi:hypothetical protein